MKCEAKAFSGYRPTITGLGIGLSLVAVLATPTIVPAQNARPADSFDDEVTVFEVETPVQVFRDGEPVRGLTREDFVVTYQGEEREIVSFAVYDISRDALLGDPVEVENSRLPEGPLSHGASRALLLLFDFEFQSRGLIGRSVTSARKSLDGSFHPSDRIAVAMLGGRQGARLLTGFTRDRERTRLALDLVDAIADAKPKRQRLAIGQLRDSAPNSSDGLAEEYGVTASVAFGEGLDSIGLFARPNVALQGSISASQAFSGLPIDAGPQDVFGIGRRLASFEKYRNTADYAEALGNLATVLSGVEGQKYAVLFSQGPPLASLLSTAGPTAEEGSTRTAKAMAKAFGQMVRAGWQIHALGQGHSAAAGFNTALAINYDIGVQGAPSVDALPGSTGPSGGAVGANFADGGNTLWFMAQGTGGKAYLNANLPAVEDFLDHTSVTYTLRFLLPEISPKAGKERFKVRLVDRRRGDELQYRNFFYPPVARSDMNEVELRMADARDRIRAQSQRAATTLEFSAHAFADPSELDTAWLTVHLPGSQLTRTFKAREAGSTSAVRFSVLAGVERSEAGGEVVLDHVLELDASLLSEPPEDGLTFFGRLDMSPEDIARVDDLRIAVELDTSGTTTRTRLQRWTASQSVDRGPMDTDPMETGPMETGPMDTRPESTGTVGPFFLPQGLERFIVRGTFRDGEPVSSPLAAPGGKELLPLPFVEVEAGEEVGVMLWTEQGAEVSAEPEIAMLVAANQVGGPAVLAVDFMLERKAEVGASVLWFATLKTEDLSPGVYRVGGLYFDNPGVGFFRVLPAQR